MEAYISDAENDLMSCCPVYNGGMTASNGKIIREYEYDSTGNLIKETRYEGNFMIEEWEYDNMGNLIMLKHTEYVDGEITDYSWNEYEYITIILH